MTSPSQTHPTQPEFVPVDTALTVLSQVNLLRESNALALDVGGSLAKLIYLQPRSPDKSAVPPLKIHQVDGNVATDLTEVVPALNGVLHFFAFESRNIHLLLQFIRDHWPDHTTHRQIRATGGGSFKYEENFRQQIGVTLARLDEMACTVAGLNFLLTSVKNEVYSYCPSKERLLSSCPPLPPNLTRSFVDTTSNPFPYLLVNIGSGVSIVKVTGHDSFERVSGSSLGGGTFWGLARMMLDCETFDDVLNLTHCGDNRNVDMMVGDIYGGAYESLGLDENVIAASMGKATMRTDYTRQQVSQFSVMRHRLEKALGGTMDLWLSFWRAVPGVSFVLKQLGLGDDASRSPSLLTHVGAQYRPQDVALSLLRMVSYNIGQIAYLNARVHGLSRIYFGGNFIRNNPYTIGDISFAVDFWSGGKTKALFLKHDGYLGAIGAFIGASSADPMKVFHTKPPESAGNLESKSQSNTSSKPDVKSASKGRKVSSSSVPEEATIANVETSVDKVRLPTANGHSKPSQHRKKKKKNIAKENGYGATGSQNGIPPVVLANGNGDTSHESHADEDWTTVTRIRRRGTGNENAP